MPDQLQACPKVEVDVADLSNEEWFAVVAMMGLKPGAESAHQTEYRQQALGMSKAQQLKILQKGVEGLVQRKVLFYEIDPVTRKRKTAPDGRPIYVSNPRAKIIQRARDVEVKS